MAAPTKVKQKTPEQVLSIFAFHGLDVDPKEPVIKNGNVVTDCPFCGKAKHFYIRVEGESTKGGPGSWDCKRCGAKGNIYSFLQQLYEHCARNTSQAQFVELRDHRNTRCKSVGQGVPAVAYQDLAWNPMTSRWLIPLTNQEGAISNLLAYDHESKKPFACPTPNLNTHPYNSRVLGENQREHWGGIIVCEGIWDALAMQWLLSHVPASKDDNEYAVIGLCGASNLPDTFVKALDGHNVTFFFDNDDAGEKALNRTIKALSENAPNCNASAVNWPASYEPGFDVADFISRATDKAWITWRDLKDLTKPVTLDADTGDTGVSVRKEPLPKLNRASFASVQADFTRTGVDMPPKMRDGLAVALACVVSKKLPGDPLWMFLIGPSGSGKSLVLETLIESEGVEYVTSFTSKSFISGFACGDEDPSILARVTDPSKCLVVKDYTAVITLPSQELETLYGLMRDAYDGRVNRPFGNNVVRDYHGYFSMVAGVTPEIHTLSHSHLGERFLKCEIAGATNLSSDKAIYAALRSGLDAQADYEGKRTRQASVVSYLDYLESLDETPPSLPEKSLGRVVAQAKFVAACRSKVSRDEHGALRYEASTESATRVAKQMAKLVQSLCVVLGLTKPDERVLDLASRVAWDTSYGRQRDVLWTLYNNEAPMTTEQVAEELDMTHLPTWKTLRDLHDLGLLSRRKGPKSTEKKGRPSYLYALTATMQGIMEDSCVIPA